MPAGNPQAYMRQGMPRRQAFALALQKMKQNRGRRIGRNPTPGVPRRVGPPTNFRGGPSNPRGRQSYQSWLNNGPIDDTPGPRRPNHWPGNPNRPDFDNMRKPFPPNYPGPLSEHGVRGRMNVLHNKNRRDDTKALKPLLRMYTRAQQGKQFGGYVFGKNQGNTTNDFLDAIRSHTKGSGLYRLFNQQINPPKKKKKPRPMPLPTPEPME